MQVEIVRIRTNKIGSAKESLVSFSKNTLLMNELQENINNRETTPNVKYPLVCVILEIFRKKQSF